ncbi:hypothetical protein BTUL_0151g00210 [Botrytis tulipae]|uniref:Uncharacterized protein n=1 Tax=Botrytis tulipae TaxID=87230 RepID=A0A4Z1EF90_9HELO|nr:hypothetical protein BTUL_0151g00210 [Botrytis tulipae]
MLWEDLKTRAELLFGISDSMDEMMESDTDDMVIVYLGMKEKGVSKSLRVVVKVLGEMSKACDDALKDMPKAYWEEEEDGLDAEDLERYHALLDPRRVQMRKGVLAPGKVVGASKPAKKDWSLIWEGGLESKPDGKDEKWSKKMEMFEIEAASIV